MKKDQKTELIDSLAERLKGANSFYIADTSGLNAATTSRLRRTCFKKNIELKVVKNSLLQKAMERSGKSFDEFFPVLAGPTSVMFSESANEPAKLIKEFRKAQAKPSLKGAYVEECIYLGDNQLDTLISIKSRLELIGELIGLLQSPAKNVISALQSGGNTLSGLVKTLSEKPE